MATHWDLIDERSGASIDPFGTSSLDPAISGGVDGIFAGAAGLGSRPKQPLASAASGGGLGAVADGEGFEAGGVSAVEEATGTSNAVHSFVRPPGAAHVSSAPQLLINTLLAGAVSTSNALAVPRGRRPPAARPATSLAACLLHPV